MYQKNTENIPTYYIERYLSSLGYTNFANKSSIPQGKLIYPEEFINIAPLIVGKNGRPLPNPMESANAPFYFSFEPDIDGSSIVTLAPGDSTLRILKNDKESPITLTGLIVDSTDVFTVQIYDGAYSQFMSNREIHSETIAGDRFFPYMFPYPILIDELQFLRVQLQNISTVQNTIQFTFIGATHFWDIKSFFKETMAVKYGIGIRPFWYTTNQNIDIDPAITTKQQGIVTMIDNADFEMKRLTQTSTGNYNVRPFMNKRGNAWSNFSIPNVLLGGDGKNYWDFPELMIQRLSDLAFEFTDLSGVDNEIFVTLHGINYYYDR